MIKHFAVFCFMVLLIEGCVTPDLSSRHLKNSSGDSLDVWPPPPQKPRIRFERSISGSHDIGMKRSWLRKTIDSVFGQEEVEEKMLRPYGVCADSERIYVTDPGLSLVHVFDTHEKKYFRIRRAKGMHLISL